MKIYHSGHNVAINIFADAPPIPSYFFRAVVHEITIRTNVNIKFVYL